MLAPAMPIHIHDHVRMCREILTPLRLKTFQCFEFDPLDRLAFMASFVR